MLSRLAAQANKNVAAIAIRSTSTTSTCNAAESAERDLVNFPRPQRYINPPATRFVFIPEQCFKNLYKKTGVTGPYMFGVTFGTFLLSKEYMIINGEFNVAILMALLGAYAIKKWGGLAVQALDKKMEADEGQLKAFRVDSMNSLNDTIENEKKEQAGGEGQKYLFEVKRENIGLQLETEYRKRMLQVYAEVKRKLDFHLETGNIKRQVEQKHMVDWIIKQVKSSITPEQEKQSLQSCMARIKQLSTA